MISIGEKLLPNDIEIDDTVTGYENHSVLSYNSNGTVKYLGVVESIAASSLTFVDFARASTEPLILTGTSDSDDIILGGFGDTKSRYYLVLTLC